MRSQPETWFDRMVRVIRQKLVARANRLDDPAEAIDVVMAQQLEAISRTRADLASVVAGEKRLGMLADELDERAMAHLATAREAKHANDADKADRSMRRAISGEHLAREARAHVDEVIRQRREVESLLEEMREQYERLRLRRESVRAMTAAARAVGTGNASLTPMNEDGADRENLLQRAHDTLADLRAHALALADLRKSGALDPVGPSEFDGAKAIGEGEVRDRLATLD